MKKKFIIGLFAIVICLILVGCGKDSNSSSNQTTTPCSRISCSSRSSRNLSMRTPTVRSLLSRSCAHPLNHLMINSLRTSRIE